jgi:peptidoglycan/LPS O-acetylase OafA/YrhL
MGNNKRMTSSRYVGIVREPLVRARMPELDSLRGVAILLVLFLHGFACIADPASFIGFQHDFMVATSYGWIGVQLFFVLSGFLITGILLDSKDQSHYYRRFYTRRALRILPAYYVLLLILALLARPSWLGSHSVGTPFLLLSFFYLSNVTQLFGVPMQYTVLWSLAVEEHFYLIWPAVARRRSRGFLTLVAVSVFLASPIARAFSMHFGRLVDANFYTWCNADGLALGAILAVALRDQRVRRKDLWCLSILAVTISGATLALGAKLGMLAWGSTAGFALRLSFLNIGFAALLVVTVLVGTSSKKFLVNIRSLQFFGYISYGLYLLHMLFFYGYDQISRRFFPTLVAANGHFGRVVLQFVCAGGLSVLAAKLFRQYFEEHFLKFKEKSFGLIGSEEDIPEHSKCAALIDKQYGCCCL